MLFGAFALGYAGPSWEAISTARGAAVRLFEIEDRVIECPSINDEEKSSCFLFSNRLLILFPTKARSRARRR